MEEGCADVLGLIFTIGTFYLGFRLFRRWLVRHRLRRFGEAGAAWLVREASESDRELIDELADYIGVGAVPGMEPAGRAIAALLVFDAKRGPPGRRERAQKIIADAMGEVPQALRPRARAAGPAPSLDLGASMRALAELPGELARLQRRANEGDAGTRAHFLRHFEPRPDDPVWSRIRREDAFDYQTWIERMIEEAKLEGLSVHGQLSAEGRSCLRRLALQAKEEDDLSPHLLLLLAYQFIWADTMLRRATTGFWVAEMVRRPDWAPPPEQLMEAVAADFFARRA